MMNPDFSLQQTTIRIREQGGSLRPPKAEAAMFLENHERIEAGLLVSRQGRYYRRITSNQNQTGNK